MDGKSVEIELTVPCGGNQHPVRLRLRGWGPEHCEVLWSPCREGLEAFGPLAPCEEYLKQGRLWWDDDFRLGLVTLCEDAGAVSILVQALGDEYVAVRWRAAWALGEIGDASAVPALIEALGDRNEFVRWAALDVLGTIGDASAVPALVKKLRDWNWGDRCAAARALGRIGDASAVPALVQALEDSDWEVRGAVARALGWIGDASAVPALDEALLRETVSKVRDVLHEVIATLNGIPQISHGG